jgi:cyclopropane fatty-acyl-phospholipid synthase-like methyltransferase
MGNDSVKAGYNQIADMYDAQRDLFQSIPWLERFVGLLPKSGAVLDVGCGAGRPVDEYLVAHGCTVHGLDLSERMIELARRQVPQATFEVRDMLDLAAGEFSVDGIVAFYSIFHTPRDQHQRLLDTLASFLSPGGVMLITMEAGEWEGFEDDFHGARMYWSHFGSATNVELVENAGMQVLLSEIDHSGGERHQVIIAQRGIEPAGQA